MNNLQILKSVSLLFGVRGFASIYSIILFTFGLSNFPLEEYGSIMISVSIFGLFGRVVSWGFEFKIRNWIDDFNIKLLEVMLAKLILTLVVILGMISFSLLFSKIPNLNLMMLALFFYSFDTMPYFQAALKYEKVILYILLSLITGVFYLLYNISFNTLTSTEYLTTAIIFPSLGWMFVVIKEIFLENNSLDTKKIFFILKDGFKMFTVAQLPALYVNILPILVGLQSELYVAMYSIVNRISNFGKSFGRIVNLVFFYNKKIPHSFFNFLLAISGSIIISITACFLVYFFFNQKLSGSFQSLNQLVFFVSLFTIVGSVANYLIVNVFFENRQYIEYRNIAFFIILIPVVFFGLFVFRVKHVFTVHVLIETLLAIFCLFKMYLIKKNFERKESNF